MTRAFEDGGPTMEIQVKKKLSMISMIGDTFGKQVEERHNFTSYDLKNIFSSMKCQV
jgi:hypothetical protein